MRDIWVFSEDSFDLGKQRHQETIFTIGSGYLSTHGAFSYIFYAWYLLRVPQR